MQTIDQSTIDSVIGHIASDVAAIERALNARCIDAWPYVIVRRSSIGSISALHVIDRDAGTFNWSGQTPDNTLQLSFDRAEILLETVTEIAEEKGDTATFEIMPKRKFFAIMRDNLLRSAELFRQHADQLN